MTYPNPNIPLQPPAEWFTPPADMPRDAGCIVEANGRIYGYICHFGAVLMGGQTDKWTPPRSRTNYAYAHTGDTVCEDGSVVKTANLGGDAGHASVSLDDPERLSKLQSFYENTSTQLARVRYGEDSNGVWFAGACWPTVTDIEIAKLRASARSGHWAAIGDWRDMHTGRAGYELVGACLVNVPGLKYARADKAASGVILLSPFQLSASGADHAGAMVALMIDDATAKQLAVDGGEPAEDMHITLAYFEDGGADRADWDAIHQLVANIKAKHMPLAGKVGGQGVFRAPEQDVHWAHPDVPGLSELRTELVNALDLAGFTVRKDHGYTPHITIAYTEPGAEAPQVGEYDLAFDDLTLAVGGDMTQLSATRNGNSGSFTIVTQFGATDFADLPVLDDRAHEWDASGADQRVRDFTKATDAPNDAYRKAFFWFDGEKPDDFGSYKLGYADVVDDKLVAVPRGVFAVAAVLQGSRGGVEGISDSDIESIKANVTKYYDKMAKQFDDPSIVPPWSDKVASSGSVEFASETGVQVSGTLVVEGQQTEDGRFIEAGAVSHRELPLPLYAQLPNSGHEAAELVGTIDTISDSADNPQVKQYTGTVYPGYGTVDANGVAYGARTLQAIADKAMRGISIDGAAGPDDGYIDENDVWHMTNIVVIGGTLTPMPAFADASVEIGAGSGSTDTAPTEVQAAATVSLSAEGDGVDAENLNGDNANGDTTTPDGESTQTAASADQVAAVSDKVDAVLDAVGHLTELVSSSQMSARQHALAAREAKIAAREKDLGI